MPRQIGREGRLGLRVSAVLDQTRLIAVAVFWVLPTGNSYAGKMPAAFTAKKINENCVLYGHRARFKGRTNAIAPG